MLANPLLLESLLVPMPSSNPPSGPPSPSSLLHIHPSVSLASEWELSIWVPTFHTCSVCHALYLSKRPHYSSSQIRTTFLFFGLASCLLPPNPACHQVPWIWSDKWLMSASPSPLSPPQWESSFELCCLPNPFLNSRLTPYNLPLFTEWPEMFFLKYKPCIFFFTNFFP